MTRIVAVAIGSRANWGSCQSVCRELLELEQSTGALKLVVYAYASALLDTYGNVARDIEAEGMTVVKVPTLIEGGAREMVMTSSMVLGHMGAALEGLGPDVVYVVGDRYEVLPVAYAAQLLGIPVAHQMGGELSGSVDEATRHAITKLSHWHFAATEQAAERIRGMGERHVWNTGCPRLDLCKPPRGGWREADRAPSVVVSQHPVTTEEQAAAQQLAETLSGVQESGWNGSVHLFWPNSDAGSRRMVSYVRKHVDLSRYKTHRNMEPEQYMQLLRSAVCLVGNSSSGIREGAFIGVPVVNVGSRQQWRERAANVIDVACQEQAIARAVRKQLEHGPYEPSELYGNGTAGRKIARVLAEHELPKAQKEWAA